MEKTNVDTTVLSSNLNDIKIKEEVVLSKGNTATKDVVIIKIINNKTNGWQGDLKITFNNSVMKIKSVTMDSTEIFKIHGLISSYHAYVEYYNKLIQLTAYKPESIEYLQKVSNLNILQSIEKIDKDILELRNLILGLEKEIIDIVIMKIKSKHIELEVFNFRYLLKSITSLFSPKSNKFKPNLLSITL